MKTQHGLVRVKAETAAEICAHLSLEDDERRFLEGGPSPRVFRGRLQQAGQFPTMIRFRAPALPRRGAVWWGCLCLWRATGCQAERLSLLEQEALRSAVLWVLEPNEERRRGAEKAGKAADLSTVAGCLAMACFWSSGSMTAPPLPAVPTPPLATAQTVAGAIVMAAVLKRPQGCRLSPALRRAAWTSRMAIIVGTTRSS